MKKLKSIGFAALYLVIPIAMQFVLGFILTGLIVINSILTRTKFDVELIQEKFSSNQFNIILVALINLVLIVSFGLWYYFIRTRRERTEVPYRKIMSVPSLACTLGLAICGQFICNIIMIGFSRVFPAIYENYLKLAEGLDINVLPAWVMLFIVAVWSPLAEELVFRGMIFRTLRKGFSFLPAALISGILFGAYHMNWVQGVYAGALGVLLAFTYEKTNSLLGCYLFHFFFNLSSYAIEALQEISVIPTVLLGLLMLVMHGVSVLGIGFLVVKFSRMYPAAQAAVDEEAVSENSEIE